MGSMAFLDQIATMIPAFRSIERQMDQEIGRRFNAFDLFNTNENASSQVLAALLNPKGAHGQGTLFLRLFLKNFLSDTKGDSELETASVKTELLTQDKSGRMDVHINLANGRRIVIENKFRGAPDGSGQVEKYFYDGCSHLVYLSQTGSPPSPESIKKEDREKREKNGTLIIGAWHVAPNANDKQKDNRVSDITTWLDECLRASQPENIRWFLKQFASYIRKEITRKEEHTMVDDIITQHALKNEENLETALKIGQLYGEIKNRLVTELFNALRHKLRGAEFWRPVTELNEFPLQKESWPQYVGIGWENGIGIKAPICGSWKLPSDNEGNYFSKEQQTALRQINPPIPDGWEIRHNNGWPTWIANNDEIAMFTDILQAIQVPENNALIACLSTMIEAIDSQLAADAPR